MGETESGINDHVKVTAPDADGETQKKEEEQAKPVVHDEPESIVPKIGEEEEEDERSLSMPGSFDMEASGSSETGGSWGDMLKKLHLQK